MADDKAQSTAAGDKTFYARLIIDKARRRLLSLAVIFGFIAFCILIGQDMLRPSGSPWVPELPIVVLGLMVAAVPLSEKWEYKPWQARARQYERNQ